MWGYNLPPSRLNIHADRERKRERNTELNREDSFNFSNITIQRTTARLLEKNHRSWLTLPVMDKVSLSLSLSCICLFFETCTFLLSRVWSSSMRAASARDFLRALTIIAWNVVIVCDVRRRGVQVRDDSREHRKLVEREIEAVGIDPLDADVSIPDAAFCGLQNRSRRKNNSTNFHFEKL